jgi:hypothetical protein
MTLSDITLPDLEFVCLNMREVDRIEVLGVRPHDNLLMLAWEAAALIRNQGRGRIAWANGKPAAVVAVTEDRAGVWQIMMFWTEDFKAVAFACMRWARETLRELVGTGLCRRLQCDSRVGHDEAWRFLMALGAEKEGPPMRGFGKDGGDYQRFVWIKGENDHVLFAQNAQRPEARGRALGT